MNIIKIIKKAFSEIKQYQEYERRSTLLNRKYDW